MDKKSTRPTTPEEEGIELHSDADAWERFERTVKKVIKSPPVHRTGKPSGGGRPKKSGRGARDQSATKNR